MLANSYDDDVTDLPEISPIIVSHAIASAQNGELRIRIL